MPLHRGKIAREPTVLEVRALVRDDLALLTRPEMRGGAAADSRLTALRDPHHRLARFLAAGLPQAEAGSRAGYSYNRVSTLKKDPAFMELVAVYRDKVTQSFVDKADTYHELLFTNMVKAERMLSDTLDVMDEDEDGPRAANIPKLIAISRDAADRTGYGKHQTQTINGDFAAQLEASIARSKTIEGRVLSPALAPQSPRASAPAATTPEDSSPAPANSAPDLSRLVRRI